MKRDIGRKFCRVTLAIFMAIGSQLAGGQPKAENPRNPVNLELTAEVAATTEDGYPSALRITLKNVGDMAEDMPMPNFGCPGGDGALHVQVEWQSEDGMAGSGGGCGGRLDHRPPLIERVRHEWLRLQPGEFLVMSQSIRPSLQDLQPGFVSYWVEYSPPILKAAEILELQGAGYLVPTQKIETTHETFRMR